MTTAKTAAASTILSGHCGIARHRACAGSYGGYPCHCDCHTAAAAEPEPEVLGEIAAALTELGAAAAAETAVTAPPFPYFGGKTRLAERIVSLLPEHQHYVEPFAGSLAVLLAKPRAAMETVNDLDRDLMTFWRVLRDRPEDLARVCALTPHARAEHQAAYDLTDVDDLERARLVWVRLSQGRNGTMRRTGWRFYEKPRGGMSMPGYLASYVDRFGPCVERLAGVSLECRPALDVITAYGEHEGVLLYCDPPYLASTRGWGNNYAHELRTDDEHRELAAALTACTAGVVLSGYHSPLYDELYDGWHRIEIPAWTGNGIRNGATKTDGDRTEVLWSNRPFPAAEPSLFDELSA